MKIATTQVWVHDQDVALEFYTKKLGFEVRQDVTVPEMGNFRWLTVAPPGEENVAIVLMAIPGPPMIDGGTRKEIENLVAKGFAGTVFITVDDVQTAFKELSARGVQFTEEPEQRPYGIDCAFRDPSGNSFRLTQLTGVGLF